MKDRAPGSSSAGRQARRTRSAVSQAMPAAPPRASQARVRASASANGAASAIPTRSKPSARACAFTAAASAARSLGSGGALAAAAPGGALAAADPAAWLPRGVPAGSRGRPGRGDSGTGRRAVALVAPGDEPLDRLAVERRAEAQDDVVAAGVGERVEMRQVLDADAGGPLDLRRVAAELPAPVVEHAVLAPPVFHAAKAVPGVGVLRGDPQGDLLALAADEDRNGAAHGGRAVLGPALLDDGQRRLQVVQTGRRGAELVAVVAVLALEPAGANAEREATAADVVDGGGHFREQRGVAVAVAGDHAADRGPRAHLGHRREHRVPFQ